MVGFLFGGNTGDTAESLKRKREMIQALQDQIMGQQPRTVAEGIGALMKGAVAGIGRYRADNSENKQKSAATEIYNKIIGGQGNVASPSTISQMQSTSPSISVGATVPSAVDISGSKQDFVSALLPAAMEESKRTGVDPRIIVAQAAQETGWGKSAPGNNYFGIKSHGQGGGQNLTTHEVIDGKRVKINDSFRTFGSPEESVRGYGDFITQNPRYEKLRSAQGLDAQLEELQASGYATDPNYSRSVGAIARGIQLPQEVASADPRAAFSAAQAIEQQAPMPQPGGLADEVAAFQQTPEYAAQFPGRQPRQPMPQGQAQPQEMAQPQPQPQQQMAQAQPPQMQGGQQGPMGVDPQILQLLTNPFISPEQKAVLQSYAQQQMQQAEQAREQQIWLQRQQYEQQAKQSDPNYQMGIEKSRLEIEQMKQPGYQVLSAEERQQLGIPENDQRVYQRSRDGKVDAVGGAGQTINVGNEIETRKAAAAQVGLSPDDPRYQQFILSGKFPREDAQQLTATDKKAILEADEMVAQAESTLPLIDRALELSGQAYEGPTAGVRGWLTGALGNDAGQATTELDNVIASQALTQLKAIFGGAPTEGERAILLEISGASSQPQEVRDNILKRAKEAVMRRRQFYQERANNMRGSTYYKPSQGKPVSIGGYTIEEVE